MHCVRCRTSKSRARNPLIGQPTRSGLLISKTNSGRSSRFAAADEADRPIAFVRAAGIGHLRRANWPISGQWRCNARLVAVEPLDPMVWDEVCRLLRDPARVLHECQRRLDMVRADPHRLELDSI